MFESPIPPTLGAGTPAQNRAFQVALSRAAAKRARSRHAAQQKDTLDGMRRDPEPGSPWLVPVTVLALIVFAGVTWMLSGYMVEVLGF